MDKGNARYLWAQMCAEYVGATQEEAIERITAFGNVATAANLPLYCRSNELAAEKVASWLEAWARDIRGNAPAIEVTP